MECYKIYTKELELSIDLKDFLKSIKWEKHKSIQYVSIFFWKKKYEGQKPLRYKCGYRGHCSRLKKIILGKHQRL
jgi:hypothetical protein